jgi:hypothetical protein
MKKNLRAAVSGHTTADPVMVPPASGIIQRDPEFIRLPKTGTLCPFSGLTRSKMNELVLPCPQNDHKPPVKSVVLRQKGAIKGVRLIVFKSLMDYLHGQEGQAAA